MAINVKFELRAHRGGTSSTVLAKFYYSKKRFVWSLGSSLSVPLELWDKEKMRPTGSMTTISKYERKHKVDNVDKQLRAVSSKMDHTKREILSYVARQAAKEEPISFSELKEILSEKVLGVIVEDKTGKQEMTFDRFLALYIENMSPNGPGPVEKYHGRNGLQMYDEGTIRAYNSVLHKLEGYMKDRRIKSLPFEAITIEWYDDYSLYFDKLGHKSGYFGAHVKTIKSVMRVAHERKYHGNLQFTYKKFRKPISLKDSIYLNREEIAAIYNLDLSKKKGLELARDIFLIGLYTAQRVSDYNRFDKSMLKIKGGKKYLSFISKKGRKRIVVSISPALDKILQKYDYTPKRLSEQKINDRIKDVCELAGINEPITIQEQISSKRVLRSTLKYKEVTTHTARRSGATLMYLDKMRPEDIIKITGHTTTKALLTYIRESKEETAIRLGEEKFFNEEAPSSGLKVV